MDTILNVKAIHDNGDSKIQIGLKDSPFTIEREDNKIIFKDAETGDVLVTIGS
jgi:hypothetical protein